MERVWCKFGVVAPGGMVIGISPGVAGEQWLLTESGVWRSANEDWLSVHSERRQLRAGALVETVGCVAVAAATGGILYSPNRGQHWYAAWADDITSPITCFAASPGDAANLTLLAGSADAGILRSADGGRRWSLVNVGLRDYTSLALATAPSWAVGEVVFAATADGVYRSPNGGRAWKRANRGLEDVAIQALAISPDFGSDATLLAGAEDGRLFQSCDQGETWILISTLGDATPINGLCWLASGGWLVAGMGDGRILRSADHGQTWESVALGEPLLTLIQSGDRLYAGLAERGLVHSEDAGATWRNNLALAARDLTRLVEMGDTLLAYGATGGIWRATEETWERIVDLELQQPIDLIAAVGDVLFAAVGADIAALLEGERWEIVASITTGRIVAMVGDTCEAGQVWIATSHGSVWRIGANGAAWCVPEMLAVGEEPIALCVYQRAPVVATLDRSAGHVHIWRMEAASQHWSLWCTAAAAWSGAQFLLAAADSAPNLIAVGTQIWRLEDDNWIGQDLDGTPILRLLRIRESARISVVTEQHCFTTLDAITWERQSLPAPEGGLLDLAFLNSTPPRLIGLGPGGALWSTEDL